MPPTRLQRSGETLDALRVAIRDEFGATGRIVAAEKVTTGGVGGLFRKHHYEATVEVLAPGDEPSVRVSIATGGPRRAGILALLEEAEDREARLTDVPETRAAARAQRTAAAGDSTALVLSAAGSGVVVPPTDPDIATRSDTFATIMDDFTFNGLAPAGSLADALDARDPTGPGSSSATPSLATPSAAAALVVTSLPAVPDEPVDDRAAFEALTVPTTAAPRSRPGGATPVREVGGLPLPPAVHTADGDLVVVVGRPADATAVTAGMAAVHGMVVAAVTDRRSAILARATGVQEARGMVSALEWDPAVSGVGSSGRADALREIGADQVWVVVDAGRKHDDTARDVRTIAAVVPLAGIVALGMADTTTPETVHMLGLPVVDVRDWEPLGR